MPGIVQLVNQYKKLIVAISGLLTTPAIADLLLYLGPPWPDRQATTGLTLLVLLAVFAVVYGLSKQHFPSKLEYQLSCSIAIFFCCLSVYILLRVGFVYDAPNAKYQEAGGFALLPSVKKLLVKGTIEEVWTLPRQGEYDPFQIWESWTVKLVRLGLLTSWLVLFSMISYSCCLALLLQDKRSATHVSGSDPS